MIFEDREDVKEAIATGYRASDLLQEALQELREKDQIIKYLRTPKYEDRSASVRRLIDDTYPKRR